MMLNLTTLYCSLIKCTLNCKLILRQNVTVQICNVHICETITVKLIYYLTKRCQKVNVNYER